MAEAGMGSSQHLKRGPLQPDGFELGLHVPTPYVVPPQRS
jgi:hypothetical protein